MTKNKKYLIMSLRPDCLYYSLNLLMPFENYHDGFNSWNSKWKDTDFGMFCIKSICEFTKKVIAERLQEGSL